MSISVLREGKNRLERENEEFLRAVDKRANAELKFREALDCLSKMNDTANDALKYKEQFNSDKEDGRIIAEVKKERKFIADLKMNLDREINLSRKRSHRLAEISNVMNFDTETTGVVEISDSPPRLVDDDSNSNSVVKYTEVRFFDIYYRAITMI